MNAPPSACAGQTAGAGGRRRRALVALHGAQQQQRVEGAQLRLQARAQPLLQQQSAEQARCQPVRLTGPR